MNWHNSTLAQATNKHKASAKPEDLDNRKQPRRVSLCFPYNWLTVQILLCSKQFRWEEWAKFEDNSLKRVGISRKQWVTALINLVSRRAPHPLSQTLLYLDTGVNLRTSLSIIRSTSFNDFVRVVEISIINYPTVCLFICLWPNSSQTKAPILINEVSN